MKEPITNSDIVARIDALEQKVDHVCNLLEQASGAWFFVKLLGTVALGIAVVWNAVTGWWAR